MELFTQLNREGTTIVQVTHSEVNASYGIAHHPNERWLAGRRHRQSRARAQRGGRPLMMARISRSPMLAFAALRSAGARPSSANRRTGAQQPQQPAMPNAPIAATGAARHPHAGQPGAFRIRTIRSTLTRQARCRSLISANSTRLQQLIRDGKLYISLQDAIALALENNLDLAIARYNLPIADTDILRTKAGGSFRGVNTGVVQGTPGGGVGGFGTGAPGAGAGGTTGGAGGAGAGAAGLVQSTLGIGTRGAHRSIPFFTATGGLEHLTPAAGQPSDLRRAAVATQHHDGESQLSARRFLPAPASALKSTTIGRPRTAFSAASARSWGPTTASPSSSSCWRASAPGPTCASCASRRTTRRFPTSPSRARSSPRSRRSPTSTGTWSAPTKVRR